MRSLRLVLVLLVTACGAEKNLAAPSTTPVTVGEWRGEWQPQSCIGADAPGGCSAFAGGIIRVYLVGDLAAPDGTLTLGTLMIPVTGTATATGEVTLSGSTTENGFTTTITAWQSTVAGTTMAGSFTFTSADQGSTVTVAAAFSGRLVSPGGGNSRRTL
jgi:hypothetical protein